MENNIETLLTGEEVIRQVTDSTFITIMGYLLAVVKDLDFSML